MLSSLYFSGNVMKN